MAKYDDPVMQTLRHAQRLSVLLRTNRERAGCDTSDENTAKIRFYEKGMFLVPRKPGPAEVIVEELMVAANHAVADYFLEKKLPALFRVQAKRGDLAEYQTHASLHASLRLEDYAHTTSPIRRLPDMLMQQVLTAHLLGADEVTLHRMFDSLLVEAAEAATKGYRKARGIQMHIEKMCFAEYFHERSGQKYSGILHGISKNGIQYVRVNDLNIKIPIYDPNGSTPMLSVGARVVFKVSSLVNRCRYSAYAVRMVA